MIFSLVLVQDFNTGATEANLTQSQTGANLTRSEKVIVGKETTLIRVM